MLLGAILGLVGSVIPELVKLYKDHQDRKHELEMLKLQIENAKALAQIRIEEAKALAQIKLDEAVYEYAKPEITLTGFKLADVLQAIGKFLNLIVRPIITFTAMGLWLYAMSTDYKLSSWEADAITCIIVFWFGNRSFQRALGRIQ
ncbi:MAG: hypothetical protein QXJ20_02720 [Candidatus Aenigmatarchaeota archaeon]